MRIQFVMSRNAHEATSYKADAWVGGEGVEWGQDKN